MTSSKEQDKPLPALAPGPHGPVSHGSTTISKPRKNSTACLPCKQAKRKCSGRPAPCKACQNTDAECIFDETLDLQRKVAARRTLGELEYYRGLLHSLLDLLRSSDDEKIHHILDTIRRNARLNIIASAVDAPNVDISDAGSDGRPDDAIAQHERLCADSHSRITVERLCDRPFAVVPAHPWTAVTNDNQLVSHLISLYFTWDHPLLQLVDQEIFLREMSSGNLYSEFCTPFLVNSMLALACNNSDFPEAFAIPTETTSWGHHFYREAERCWRAEEGQNSLTNIQALALMSITLRFRGKDKLSWLFLRQAVQLAQDFGLFQVPRLSRHVDWSQMHPGLQKTAAVTAWGIFILNSEMSLESHKIADIPLPIARPYIGDCTQDDIKWTPYPRSNHIDYTPKPALLRFLMVGAADLSELSVEAQDLLFDKAFDARIDDLWTAVASLHSRLEMWLNSLPPDMRYSKEQREQIPQILFVHVRYHHIIISLFASLLDREDFRHESHPVQFEQTKSIQLHSAKEISECLGCYHQEYGLRQIPRQFLVPASSSAAVLLTGLEEEEAKTGFVELCRFLVAFGKRYPPAKAILRRLEAAAQDERASLPSEALAVLDHRGLESSQWL